MGSALRLDLGKRGLRGGERLGDRYLLLAGRSDGVADFVVYSWSGSDRDQPRAVHFDFKKIKCSPEDVIVHPDGKTLYFLSDDGNYPPAAPKCSKRKSSERFFRIVEARLTAE